MKRPKLIIIADDLTGAADSAARCVNAGLSAEVWFEFATQDVSTQRVEADVVALSTDSRFLSPLEARARVEAAHATLSEWSGVTWYKKIDSTLRGNLGAELDAVLAMRADSAVVICPAFPAQERGLENGTLVYSGAEPRHLPSLLAEQSAAKIGAISLATVRQGHDALARAMQEQRVYGARLLVVDGLTDGDLETIVAAAQAGDFVLCGSAGMVAPLAAHVAQRMGKQVVRARVPSGPLLAVVGSGSAMAHVQVAQVAATEAMRVRALDNGWYEADLVGAQSHPIGDWLLHLAPPAQDVPLEGPVARAEAARLADLTSAAVAKLQPSALLVVGGDTAHYVLRRLGIERLTVAEELLPGIPLCFGRDYTGERRAVILKAGNFGDAQTLVDLQRALHQRQSQA